MAHRGGAGLWPENTMYAFERAEEMGVDVLETEIYSTADGVLVLIHDSTVDRTTNGSGPVNSFTLKDLKALDAGFNWTTDGGGNFPFRDRGITVPTLEETFAAFPNLRINIDIKQVELSLVEPLCRLIRTYDRTKKVMVASFQSKSLEEFRHRCPEVATSASTREISRFFLMNSAFLARAYNPACHALQVPEYRMGLKIVTKRFVDGSHRRNLKVHVWTVNDTEDMKRLLDLGVDGIITDYPDRLLPLLVR
jgi:glycerophosphoryl diester phosphodiesterase